MTDEQGVQVESDPSDYLNIVPDGNSRGGWTTVAEGIGYHSTMWRDHMQAGRDSDDFKDTVLNRLAPKFNVAQFVSFAPNLAQRYAWICGRQPNDMFPTLEAACEGPSPRRRVARSEH